MGVLRRLKELYRPPVPEPIDASRWRKVATAWVGVSILLLVFNLTAWWVMHARENPGIDMRAGDRFIMVNVPGHLIAIAAALVARRAPGERRQRALFMIMISASHLTSVTGQWLQGSVTSWNFLWAAALIFAVRLAFDARIGLFTLAVVVTQFSALVALELGGVLPSHALWPGNQLQEYRSPDAMLFAAASIVLAQVFSWVLASAVAARLRATEHAMRELNATLESRVAKQVAQLERAARLRRYLAPQVAEQILASDVDPGSVRERRPLSVMFADLKGFTPMVEQIDPEILSAVLTRYFDELAQIAFRHGGTIDKFIGDALMVFFGAPEASSERDQALRCVAMSLEIQRRLAEIGPEFVALGAPAPLVARIGIGSGVATVGAFGAKHRAEFTAVGAPVNRAARLEPLAPPGGVLIDEQTHALIADLIEAEPHGEVTLKGFAHAVRTFVVVALRAGFAEPAPEPRKLDSSRFFR
jgi:class 3 adenylate cyclase